MFDTKKIVKAIERNRSVKVKAVDRVEIAIRMDGKKFLHCFGSGSLSYDQGKEFSFLASLHYPSYRFETLIV